jgi:hypothetical protein
MYNYLTTPFIFTLPGFRNKELEPHTEQGEVWRVLEVIHPNGWPTHTKIQRFYFDSKSFMLRRIDYKTDILGGVGSHYCFDYKTYDGIVIPTTRRVVWRAMPGRIPLLVGPTSFGLQYMEVKIIDKDGSVHSGEKTTSVKT